MKFSFVLAFAVVLTAALSATAQEAKTVAETPCTIETLSRPTLKRRQTNPDDQPKVKHQDVVIVATPPCDSGSAKPDNAAPAMNPESSGQPTAVKPVTIKFEGLFAVEESEVRTHFRERGISRALDSGITSESIADAEGLIKSLLSDYGHRRAVVSSRVEQGANELPVVTFVISEGPRFTISEIRFVGNRIFSEQLLASKMNDCLAGFNENRPPKVYRSDVFDYCTHLLASFERSQGYLQTKFSEPQIEENGQGLIITVASTEGVLFRVGRIEIAGGVVGLRKHGDADPVAEQNILALIGMRTGDIANGEKLSKALYQDLKAIYGEKGFIQYTAEIIPTFYAEPNTAAGVVDFEIVIDEGRRFRIRKMSFKGDVPESELRQWLTLREGDVFNQKLFEDCVTKMNEMGSFNWIDKDKDVDYRTNEEEGLVDLVIKVTRHAAK